MVKSVDTRDLKSLGESRAGSSPAERTKCPHCNGNGAFYDSYGAPVICSCFELQGIWCNTHQRWAKHCKYRGGIMLPCVTFNLLEIVEIIEDDDP